MYQHIQTHSNEITSSNKQISNILPSMNNKSTISISTTLSIQSNDIQLSNQLPQSTSNQIISKYEYEQQIVRIYFIL